LVIVFTEHLQIVTASNYSDVTNSHSLQFFSSELSPEDTPTITVAPCYIASTHHTENIFPNSRCPAFLFHGHDLVTVVYVTICCASCIVSGKPKCNLLQGVTVETPEVIHVTGHNYDWLPEVQAAISSGSKHHIILVAQGEPLSGIVGLVSCIQAVIMSG
jgi:hypothetical protein